MSDKSVTYRVGDRVVTAQTSWKKEYQGLPATILEPVLGGYEALLDDGTRIAGLATEFLPA